MPTCPAGHPTGSDDYCDVCGARMAGAAGAAPPAPPAPLAPPSTAAAAPAHHPDCPDCSAPRSGRFCEDCGYDFVLGDGRPTGAATRAAPAAPGWTAEVIADREYYERVLAQAGPDAASFRFPPYAPKRRITLTGEQVRIGRHSRSRPTAPEIDLGEPPGDPGVSHTHAVLLARPDDRWVLVDPGSTNGTTVNGGVEPVPVNAELPLHDGDRLHVGVWTTIILRRSQ